MVRMPGGWPPLYRPPKLILFLFPLLSFAQEEPTGRGPGRGNIREFLGLGAAPDPVAAARGEALWSPNCAFCHGPKARGAQGPNLIRSTTVLRDEKGELIGPMILKGVPDKGMPAFPSFSEGQLQDLAQFLKLQVELVANRGSYKRLNVVTGDAKAGEAYFQSVCSSCHSALGDLKGVATKYKEPDQLQARFVWPAPRASKPRNVTVQLRDGTSMKGTVKRLDDLDLSMYDAAGNYHSWPRSTIRSFEIEDPLVAHRKLLDSLTDSDMHNVTAYLVTLK